MSGRENIHVILRPVRGVFAAASAMRLNGTEKDDDAKCTLKIGIFQRNC